MADYFTQFSFLIPVTPEQGKWLMQAHERAAALIGNVEDGDTRQNIEGPPDVVSAARGLADRHDGFPNIEVAYDQENSAIWVRSEDSGDVDYTADLAQAFLRRFDLDLVLSFQWANTCSKPRLDAFSGGAAVISRRNVDWFNTATLVETAARIETERLRLKPDDELADDVDLDEAVHDIASALAADANNDGIGAQLDFLFEHGWNPPEHLVREVVS